MIQKILVNVAITAGLIFTVVGSEARAAEFYKGKTLKLIVGTNPGGGYDTYARVIAKHIGRKIPGNPSIIVQNIPGAGSLIAANYLYNVSKPNGLTMAMLISGLVMEQVMGEKAMKFDLQKFQWIGAPGVGMPACVIMGFTGLKTLDDVMKSKKKINFGAAGSSTREQARILRDFVRAPVKPILGYGGTAGIRAALERREVDGACWQWVSMKITARHMLDAKGDDKMIPFLVQGKSSDPEVKDLPQFMDVIEGKEDRAAFRAWLGQYLFFRPFALPPKTPKDRVNTLRKAFKETLEDPKFLALAKRTKMDINYVPASKIDENIKVILSTPESAKAKLKTIVGR